MTRKTDSILQIVRPDEDEAERYEREEYIHVHVEIGTPWDPAGQHLQYRTKIARTLFEVADYPVLETSMRVAMAQIEAAIRNELIPQAMDS